MPICGTSGSTVLIPPPVAPAEEDSQPVREVERVANPLNTMHKECYGADVKQRL
ncbi:hypothetical protein ACLK2I_18730 [Escherichia coli]